MRILPAICLLLSVAPAALADDKTAGHPDTSGWTPLFADLAEVEFKEGVWTIEEGVLTASEDEAIWTKGDYGNFSLDLAFKTWISAKTNPDGSEIPAWLRTPFAEIVPKGRIGLQVKHAGAPIWFRNERIKTHS